MATTNNKSKLSEDELNFTMQFAQGLYYGLTNGCYSPFIQNSNLVNLTTIPSNTPSLDKVSDALSKIGSDPTVLQGYSEFLNVFDTIYGKTIDYYDGMLSYDLRITCTNAKGEDYKSEEYQKDLRRVYKFLDSFDYKQEFRKVTKQLLKTGVSYNWFRDSIGTYNEDTEALEIEKQRNFALQILPQDKCLITGYFNKGSLLFDFDMNYFSNSGVDIALFDPWFSKRYRELWSQKDDLYIPSSQLYNRDGTYANYVQTSPIDGAWCFKWDCDNFAIVPPFASLMKSAVNNDTVANLQMDKDIISAYLLLAGEIGMKDTQKSGEKTNQTKFSPKALGDFMNLVTSGLKKNVKAVAMPLENIRGWQYNDQNPNMADSQYYSTASQGASASRLIYSSDKMSQSELQNAIITDYNLIKKLYSQYQNFLDFFVNKKTRKFKFSFVFDGSNFPFERESRQKAINELSAVGLTLNSSAWASVYGYAPQEFSRMLEEAHYGDLTDKLTLMLNKNTMSIEGESSSGRPRQEDSELGDSGETSRDYN